MGAKVGAVDVVGEQRVERGLVDPEKRRLAVGARASLLAARPEEPKFPECVASPKRRQDSVSPSSFTSSMWMAPERIT